MTNQKQIQNVVHLVYEAQKAVIDSQGNGDPGRFQHAQNMLHQVKQLLHDAIDEDHPMDPEQEKQFVHVQELVRQLEEAQNSIEATE
jgi:hypothetical protein